MCGCCCLVRIFVCKPSKATGRQWSSDRRLPSWLPLFWPLRLYWLSRSLLMMSGPMWWLADLRFPYPYFRIFLGRDARLCGWIPRPLCFLLEHVDDHCYQFPVFASSLSVLLVEALKGSFLPFVYRNKFVDIARQCSIFKKWEEKVVKNESWKMLERASSDITIWTI